MFLLADTHVHLYPCYDLLAALRHGHANLVQAAHGIGINKEQIAAPVLCLTERADCNYFEALASGKLDLGDSIKSTAEPEVLEVLLPGTKPGIFIVAGRQIITRERVEVLALACLTKIADGQSLSETLDAVREVGAVPVLSWAPGKWFFARGKLVKGVFSSASSGSIVCGDTTLRPPFWREPLIMRAARLAGFQVIAGSDPLPFAGEEQQCGRYATVIPCNSFSRDNITATLKRALLASGRETPLRRCGSRSSALEVLLRLKKNQVVRVA